MWVFDVMWVPLHFEETSNPSTGSFTMSMPVDFLPYSSWFSLGLEFYASIWVCAFNAWCRWCQSFYGRRCANPYCSSLQDEQGPLSCPDGSKLEFVQPNFKFEFGQVEPNRTAISLYRDLADVWFDPARFDPPLDSVFLLCENHFDYCYSCQCWFRYVRTIRFRVDTILIQRLRFVGSAMRVRMRVRF